MYQLRLSGSGGQGVITAAIIFAEAAVSAGFNAVQSQSYGPEARGGASKAEVIISENPIHHPHVTTPDILLALTQKAADKYFHDLNPNGTMIIDSDLVPNPPQFPNIISLPITNLAVEKVGKSLFTNIVALGVLVKVSNFLDFDAVKNALTSLVPPATVEQNIAALNLGFRSV
jgi:2-oxoglutarate ferredoxin oxidoreductase subunit gamma